MIWTNEIAELQRQHELSWLVSRLRVSNLVAAFCSIKSHQQIVGMATTTSMTSKPSDWYANQNVICRQLVKLTSNVLISQRATEVRWGGERRVFSRLIQLLSRLQKGRAEMFGLFLADALDFSASHRQSFCWVRVFGANKQQLLRVH